MIFLLTLFGCPTPIEQAQSPQALSPEEIKNAEAAVQRYMSSFPDADLTSSPQQDQFVNGSCIDCNDPIKTNLALQTICEGLNCTGY